MKKDIVWLDYARTFGIFLVIFGHCLQTFPAWKSNDCLRGIWDYVYLFHMPLFFIISGFLFKAPNVNRANIRYGGGKLIRSIILPYLIYQLVFWLILIVLKHKTIDVLIVVKMLMGILMGDGYDTPYSTSVCLPCWFLVSIIQLRLLFMFIPINRISTCCLLMASVFGLLLLKHKNLDLYFCLDSTMMAIPYFIVGHFLGKWMKCTLSSKTFLMIGILSALWVYFILQINGSSQMNGPRFGSNIFLNYSAGIAGTFLIISLSMLLSRRLGDNYSNRIISRNTLFIIFFHWVLLIPTGMIIKRILATISSRADYTLLMAIIVAVCILVISKYAIVFGVKRFPVLYGKQKNKNIQ